MIRKYFLFLTLIAGLMGAADVDAECQIQLSETQVDYGQATRGELLSRSGNNLTASELRSGDDRTLDITVDCDRATPLTLQFIGPAKNAENYRFGERGRAILLLKEVYIDGRAVEIVSGGQRDTRMAFAAGKVLQFQHSGRNLRGKVVISTWIPSDATRVGERQVWQLNGRFMVGGE